MPLKKFCRRAGCKRVVDGGGYCDEHQQPVHSYDDRRGTAAQRGYNYKWRQASIAFLKANPLCAECMRRGVVKPATCTDHVTPHKGDQRLFWDRTNWQPLCDSCHSTKTATEDGGFANPIQKK